MMYDSLDPINPIEGKTIVKYKETCVKMPTVI